MITCSALRAYDCAALRGRGDDCREIADRLAQAADTTDAEADELAKSWRDPTGRAAADLIRAQAQQLRTEGDRVRRISPILATAAEEIQQAKDKLAEADETEAANSSLRVDDRGQVSTTTAFDRLPESERQHQYTNRRTLQHAYFLALDAATRADARAAAALLALADPNHAPEPDQGPVDLSDAAIADQLANSQQGQYGDCYFLTSLAAIANADPQFIRDHIRWDPESGTYKVTIYENAVLGVITREFSIDPDELDPDKGTRGPDGEPNFLSLYEAAYRQSFHGSIFTRTGGVPSAGMLAITGHQADFTLLHPASFSEIQQSLDAQPPQAVAVATNAGPPFAIDPATQPEAERLVPKHAYWVKGFDDQGRIILVNPWGHDGPSGGVDYPSEVHLTEEQFRKVTMQSSRTTP